VTEPYDCTADVLQHSRRVGELLGDAIHDLVDRSTSHDLSKLEEPEFSTYNKFVPRLRATTFGSAEYNEIRATMGEGLQHHYEHNSHHPEHHENGVEGMTLGDLTEMLANWIATGNSLDASIEVGRQRFGLDTQLVQILWNTAVRLGWPQGPRNVERPAPERVAHYVSTACMHEHHDRCRRRCKWCDSACRCACHIERQNAS
jgi:Family of unknown function (DUF5662)